MVNASHLLFTRLSLDSYIHLFSPTRYFIRDSILLWESFIVSYMAPEQGPWKRSAYGGCLCWRSGDVRGGSDPLFHIKYKVSNLQVLQ